MPPKAKKKGRPHQISEAEPLATDTDADSVKLPPPRPRKKAPLLPTDRITRLTTGSTKPIKPKFDNSEVKEPKRSPRKKAPALSEEQDLVARKYAIMKRRADEDALREREDAEMEDLVPPTPPIPRAVRQVHSSQLSHTRDDTRDYTSDNDEGLDANNLGSDEDVGGDSKSDDDGNLEDSEFSVTNKSDTNGDFNAGNAGGDTSGPTAEDTIDYSEELLGVPSKRAQVVSSDNEDSPIGTISKKRRISTPSMLLPSRSLSSALKANEALSMSVTPHLEKRINKRLSLSATPGPRSSPSAVSVKHEGKDFDTDLSDAPPATSKIVSDYDELRSDHVAVVKATRSLYRLALITGNPWADMTTQDAYVTNAFKIACRQHSTVFSKTVGLHKKIKETHSSLRNHFISAAQDLVGHYYGLVNQSIGAIKSKVVLALDKGNYRAKSYGTVSARTGLYEHPCIAAVINKAYFDGLNSDGHAHVKSFTPLIPIPIICLSIIAIKAALSEMNEGVKAKAFFTASRWKPDYDIEIQNWDAWAGKDDAHAATAHRIRTTLSILAMKACKQEVKIGSNVILDDD